MCKLSTNICPFCNNSFKIMDRRNSFPGDVDWLKLDFTIWQTIVKAFWQLFMTVLISLPEKTYCLCYKLMYGKKDLQRTTWGQIWWRERRWRQGEWWGGQGVCSPEKWPCLNIEVRLTNLSIKFQHYEPFKKRNFIRLSFFNLHLIKSTVWNVAWSYNIISQRLDNQCPTQTTNDKFL